MKKTLTKLFAALALSVASVIALPSANAVLADSTKTESDSGRDDYNGSFATAETLINNTPVEGSIFNPATTNADNTLSIVTDKDYYKIELTESGCFTFSLDPIALKESASIHYGYLVDVYINSDKNLVYTHRGFKEAGESDTLTYEKGDTVYLVVRSFEAQGKYYSGYAPYDYKYQLTFHNKADEMWETEPNNTIIDADVITADAWYSGNMHNNFDGKATVDKYTTWQITDNDDYYVFPVNKTAYYSLNFGPFNTTVAKVNDGWNVDIMRYTTNGKDIITETIKTVHFDATNVMSDPIYVKKGENIALHVYSTNRLAAPGNIDYSFNFMSFEPTAEIKGYDPVPPAERGKYYVIYKESYRSNRTEIAFFDINNTDTPAMVYDGQAVKPMSGDYVHDVKYKLTSDGRWERFEANGEAVSYHCSEILGSNINIYDTANQAIIEVCPGNGEHKFINTVISAATSKTVGKIKSVCENCGKEKSTKKIKKIKEVSLKKTELVYTGKALKPAVVVKDSAGNTINKKYYTVTYSKNKAVGTATVKVKFKGNYSGTVKLKFNIIPA